MTEKEIKRALYQAITFGVDSALDMYHRLSDNHWHTEKPTEDGEYLVICQYVIDNHYYREKLVWEFENGDWKNKQRLTENNYIEELKILAWYGQKIEPYVEASK